MTVTVKHSKTNAISDWTQAQLDEQIALGNFAEGTVLADIVLPSDWNNDHTLTGVGTMAEQDANNVAITGGTATLSSITTPSVTATTNNLTLNSASTGTITINTASANNTFLLVKDDTTAAASTTGLTVLGASSGLGRLALRSNKALYVASGSSNNISFLTNSGAVSEGSTQMLVGHTASAVNYVQVTGNTTGSSIGPIISAQGSDAAIPLQIQAKGGSALRFSNNGTTLSFAVLNASSTVNNFQVTGSATTQALPLTAQGTDTNISMAFQPKGTGAINLAAGSSGVNISNGGTVTAITRTVASVTDYTSAPTIAISAPTTAGGVQATATCTIRATTIAIVSGGTGYTVGNVLTVSGGTSTTAFSLTVSTVSAGVITAVTITNSGTYTVAPTNPVSVTGGTGTGATFNLTGWGINPTFTITNAGSGYIEQPTITFSGGGGSGATAFASVGTTTVIRGLASTMQFSTNMGSALDLTNYGANTTTNRYALFASATGNPAIIEPRGDTNVNAVLSSRGTGAVQFYTNGFSGGSTGLLQFNVSHTASAVNYVQVTGAATGGLPAISAQGSDTDVSLRFNSKGAGTHLFYNGGGAAQFRVGAVSSAANYLRANAAIATASPALVSEGSDTNIDLALTPKGTGLVRFGTYVAGALTATGYINIKAADGTTYKVLVST